MLTIRQEQLLALEAQANEASEDRLARHAQRFFPTQVAALAEPDLLRYVRQAVAAAQGHGFVTERDICKYLNLTLALGRDFDTAPWARTILGAEHITGPTLRINRLYLKAIELAEAEGTKP